MNVAYDHFTIDNNSPLSSLSSPTPVNHMPRFQIQPVDILAACLGMKRKSNRTPEGIPTIFLANVISSLLHPLTVIFNLSLTSGTTPSQWKLAFVIPVFKKGDRRKVGNYRPISLTSSISRLFEAVLLKKLQQFVLENNCISRFQFGFVPNRTLCGNLLSSLYSWTVS